MYLNSYIISADENLRVKEVAFMLLDVRVKFEIMMKKGKENEKDISNFISTMYGALHDAKCGVRKSCRKYSDAGCQYKQHICSIYWSLNLLGKPNFCKRG